MSLPELFNTKRPDEVARLIKSTFKRMGFSRSTYLIDGLFQDVMRMFGGKYPGYLPIDMQYHDFEHTLQATVCLCKILEGRQAGKVCPYLSRRDCELALTAVLLHDTGYFKRTDDVEGTGAKYTLVHVRRSCDFAREYLPGLGFSSSEIHDVTSIISCTGPTNKISQPDFSRREARVLATILVTSDYLGQMAASDYVDELPILYHEFEEAYNFENLPEPSRPFHSVQELIRKTPDFWEKFVKPMLDADLEGVYRFIAPDANGANPYLVAVEQNIARARALAMAPAQSLDPFPTPSRSTTLA